LITLLYDGKGPAPVVRAGTLLGPQWREQYKYGRKTVSTGLRWERPRLDGQRRWISSQPGEWEGTQKSDMEWATATDQTKKSENWQGALGKNNLIMNWVSRHQM